MFRVMGEKCLFCGAPAGKLCRDPRTDELAVPPHENVPGEERAPSYRWRIPYTNGPLASVRPEDEMEKLILFVQPYYTLVTLNREVGRVAHSLVYGFSAKANKDDEEGAYAYLRFAETEMADVITQCRLLCEQLGWSYEKLLKMGEERYKERMQELKEKKI